MTLTLSRGRCRSGQPVLLGVGEETEESHHGSPGVAIAGSIWFKPEVQACMAVSPRRWHPATGRGQENVPFLTGMSTHHRNALSRFFSETVKESCTAVSVKQSVSMTRLPNRRLVVRARRDGGGAI